MRKRRFSRPFFSILPILDFDYDNPAIGAYADFCGRVVSSLGFEEVELGNEPHTLARYTKHNGYRRAAMHPDTRARLADHFADSNARLVEMLGPRFSWEP